MIGILRKIFLKDCGIKKIIPTETINCIKVNCENLNLFFFSKVEYRDQVITQTNIHISPLLKSNEINFWKSPF